MKAQTLCVIALLSSTLLLAGCPWGSRTTAEFTSADDYSNSRYGLLAGATEDVALADESTSAERELVEPDVIRQQDNLLYVLNQYRGLTIVDLETRQVLSQTPTSGYPRDLYLSEGRAYILVSYAQDITHESGMLSVSYGSKIYVLNVGDPAAVSQEGSFSFEGDLVDSRMVGSVVYAVCSDYTWYQTAEGNGIVETNVAAKSYGSTWAVSFNVADPSNIAVTDTLSFSGYGNLIHATNYAIFSVSTNWNYNDNSSSSVINYIDITDPAGKIALRGTAQIPGYMEDRFKMDAYNGVLRLVTNTGWPNRQTYVTTLDISDPDNMATLGRTTLESASGETLYATRFDGPLAYIVTYLTVDPLFVVDLSDPANPQVKGELKIPGWSTHIEPRGDRLIALGVDDTDGGRRVMVSLFDVSVPENPQRIAYESFGDDWSWSSAYGDVKAFTVTDDILLIPFSGWTDTAGNYNRLQFVSWSRDALDVKGYVDLQGSVVRSFTHEDYCYAVTQEQLAVVDYADLTSPFLVASLTLAENIVDAIPLPNGWVAEVIARNDEGDTAIRAFDSESGICGETIALPVGQVMDAFVWHDAVVLAGSVYTYDPEYSVSYYVSQVDFSVPDQPVVLREWSLPMEPWWGGWYGYYPYMEDAVVRPAKNVKQYWGGYDSSSEAIYLAGDYLILRGMSDVYDVAYGDEEPWQGLSVIDLAGSDPAYTIGLGYEEVASIHSVAGLAYITSKIRAGNDADKRGLCAYYLQIFNPSTREMEDAINVPGIFLERISGTDRLLFQDKQYKDGWETVTLLRSAEMLDKKVRLLDSVAMETGYWDILVDNDKVWYAGQQYHNGYGDDESGDVSVSVSSDVMPYSQGVYMLGVYQVDNQGKFFSKIQLAVSDGWCTLLGVKNNQACVAVGSAALAHCNFGVASPVIESSVPIMGYPEKARFSANAAYVSLGYGGLATFPF